MPQAEYRRFRVDSNDRKHGSPLANTRAAIENRVRFQVFWMENGC
jgi:hypothetical protein